MKRVVAVAELRLGASGTRKKNDFTTEAQRHRGKNRQDGSAMVVAAASSPAFECTEVAEVTEKDICELPDGRRSTADSPTATARPSVASVTSVLSGFDFDFVFLCVSVPMW